MEKVILSERFERYGAYKDSGVEWIGEIPSHWETGRLKDICSLNLRSLDEKIDRNFEFDYVDIGSVTFENGVEKVERFKFKNSPSRARRLVSEGDTIISTVRTYLKAIDYISSDKSSFIYSTGFAVLSPDFRNLYPKYLPYLVRSNFFTDQVEIKSVGMSYPAINSSELGCVRILLPTLQEQKAIATFLDRKCAQIDQAIAQKERLIELLKERQQVIIQQAVTKGLDPEVKMKDSGVEWIGEVPEGWSVKKLRYIGKTQNGISAGGDYFGAGYPFVSYGDVYNNRSLPKEILGLANSSKSDRKFFSVVKGDVFFTRTSETIEEIGFSSVCLKTIPNATFAGFLIRFRPKKGIMNPEYYMFYFRAEMMRNYFVKEMTLVTRASLSQELLKNLTVLIPPLEEQKRIADYLVKMSNVFDKARKIQQKHIEKLKEYKSILIDNAVTGKIKVK